jgi:hypothetical protein
MLVNITHQFKKVFVDHGYKGLNLSLFESGAQAFTTDTNVHILLQGRTVKKRDFFLFMPHI